MAGTARDKLVNLPRPPGKKSYASTRSVRGKAIPPSAAQIKHDLARRAMLTKAALARRAHGGKL
jgi:hypothetical protein